MAALRLVPIGIGRVEGVTRIVGQPRLRVPAADAHKYKRGLLGVVAGDMPGASVLAAIAGQAAGAGYVKLLDRRGAGPSTGPGKARALPSDLVLDGRPLTQVLEEKRWSAVLVGPGLGRGEQALERMRAVLGAGIPMVLDADALTLLDAVPIGSERPAIVATPHEGELAVMEAALRLSGCGSKPARALALARASGMVIVAKGPDTVVAAPDGRLALSPRASSWLSTAGTGDVLAGVIASRLATGLDGFEAACEGIWLHAEAARHCAPPFTASDLARAVPGAYAAAL